MGGGVGGGGERETLSMFVEYSPSSCRDINHVYLVTAITSLRINPFHAKEFVLLMQFLQQQQNNNKKLSEGCSQPEMFFSFSLLSKSLHESRISSMRPVTSGRNNQVGSYLITSTETSHGLLGTGVVCVCDGGGGGGGWGGERTYT